MSYEPLVNESFFQGPLTIGQLEINYVADDLNKYIRQYEQEFLVKLMGVVLKDAFVEGTKGENIEERWKRIASGHSFTWEPGNSKFNLSGQKQQVYFTGLICNEGDGAFELPFASPIAQYIWFHWQQDNVYGTSGTGTSLAMDKKRVYVVNRVAFANQWNAMVDTCNCFYVFMDTFADEYPEFTLPVQQWWYPNKMNPIF